MSTPAILQTIKYTKGPQPFAGIKIRGSHIKGTPDHGKPLSANALTGKPFTISYRTANRLQTKETIRKIMQTSEKCCHSLNNTCRALYQISKI